MSTHSEAPSRLVKAAIFEGDIGIVAAQRLLALEEDSWGALRDRINARQAEDPGRPLARCLMCEGPVYVRVSSDRRRLPLFYHQRGGPADCPWYSGPTVQPDEARAAQYLGRQESRLHRGLCEKIAELLRADPRHRHSTVGKYHTPSGTGRGRYPDVYAELEGLPPFTFEFQLSNTFATEIAARARYYRSQAVGLIWVLWDIDPRVDDLPQCFRDVARGHRGNLFVLSDEAIAASVAEKTLVLTCHMKQPNGSWGAPRLVRLDDITVPLRGAPYVEDTRSKLIEMRAREARKRWWKAIVATRTREGSRLGDPELEAAYASLRYHVPEIRSWQAEGLERLSHRKVHLFGLISMLFSIALSAQEGRDRNVATKHPNMRAMLNTRLNLSEYASFGALIETMLRTSPARHFILDAVVERHIARAKARVAQVDDQHPVWMAAAWLFPEALDPLVRAELEDFGSLPAWAGGTAEFALSNVLAGRVEPAK